CKAGYGDFLCALIRLPVRPALRAPARPAPARLAKEGFEAIGSGPSAALDAARSRAGFGREESAQLRRLGAENRRGRARGEDRGIEGALSCASRRRSDADPAPRGPFQVQLQ